MQYDGMEWDGLKKVLDLMYPEEICEIFRHLVEENEEFARIAEDEVVSEQKEMPLYAALRRKLSEILYYIPQDEDDLDGDVFDAIMDDDYSQLDPALYLKHVRPLTDALDDCLSDCDGSCGLECMLLFCRMLFNEGKWRVDAVLDHLLGEYLPMKLLEVFGKSDADDREKIMEWALDNRNLVLHDREYETLARGFMELLDGRKGLRVLEGICTGRFLEKSSFDWYWFDELLDVLMKLKDWKKIEKLIEKCPYDEWKNKYRGDILVARGRYDEALPCYRKYFDHLVDSSSCMEMNDLLDVIDEHAFKFSDRKTLLEIYEEAVFGHVVAFVDHVRTYCRLLPEEDREGLRKRFVEKYDTATDAFLLRAFGSDDEIVAEYRKGSYSMDDLTSFCSNLRCDWKAFSGKTGNIRYFASLIRECFGSILVYEDVESTEYIEDVLEILANRMGKVGRNEAQALVGDMPDLTAFHEEVLRKLGTCGWYRKFRKDCGD